MKAWVLHGINDIRLESMEKPSPGTGEVLLKVEAAGICGSDIPRIYRTGAHRHPLVPGHEFSGVVAELGDGVSSEWLGKRVGIFPLIPCKSCAPCRKGQYEMCRHYDYLGSRRDGGFAEYVAVPAENLIQLPDNVLFGEAAMLEPLSVAVHAARRVMPEAFPLCSEPGICMQALGHMVIQEASKVSEQKEDTVVIFGLGTIGLLLLSVLLESRNSKNNRTIQAQRNTSMAQPDNFMEEGAAGVESTDEKADMRMESREAVSSGSIGRILVIGNKELQRQKACGLGLPETDYCDSRQQDACKWIMEQTGGNGADVVFECVGRNETLTQAVDSAAPAGRICLVGNPVSDMVLAKEVYWKILRNQLTVTGTWNSSFTHERTDDWHYALELLSRKRIDIGQLITHRFLLAVLDRGLGIMRDKSEEYVKIMAEMSSGL